MRFRYVYCMILWFYSSGYVLFYEFFVFRGREDIYVFYVCLLVNMVKYVRIKYVGLMILIYYK